MVDVFRELEEYLSSDNSVGALSGKMEKPKDSSLLGLGNADFTKTGYIKKAVTAMKKDSILHEYQYFVGTAI